RDGLRGDGLSDGLGGDRRVLGSTAIGSSALVGELGIRPRSVVVSGNLVRTRSAIGVEGLGTGRAIGARGVGGSGDVGGRRTVGGALGGGGLGGALDGHDSG